MFVALTSANYSSDSNLVVLKKILLDAAISISDKFLATFATLANTTFKKDPNVCKSNLFLFAANH